jgi:hypothetical protein
MHALDYLQQLPGVERARISLDAGLAPAYVNRMLCTRDKVDYAPLALAVSAAKHSGGQVDIFASIKPGYTLDWGYLRTYLKKQQL